MKSSKIHMKSLYCFNGKSLGFGVFSSNFDALNFKWTYLGAQEELDKQTVIVTQYFERMLHAEQVFRAIGETETSKHDFSTVYSFLYFCNKAWDIANDLMISSDVHVPVVFPEPDRCCHKPGGLCQQG